MKFRIHLPSLCMLQQLLVVIFSARPPPKIGISKWMTIDSARDARYSWDEGNLTPLLLNGAITIHRNGEDTTFIISQHIERLQIVCNASYPVTWVSPESQFHSDTVFGSRLFTVYETRFSTGIKNTKNFHYQSTLDVYDTSGAASRNYTCQSMSEPRVQRSVYIFWEGPSFLAYAGEVIDARTMDNRTIVLPCTVTRPDALVFLFQETSTGYKELLRNGSITYDPKVGFTFNILQLQMPYGRFICVSEDEEVDDEDSAVRINVLHGYHDPAKKNIPFNNTISSNATFEFDPVKRKLMCCSSTGRAPNLKMIYCHHPLACRGKERLLRKISGGNRWAKNGSCTTMEVYPNDSGILRCKGDDIDVFRTYYTSLDQRAVEQKNMSIYYSMDKIPKHDLVAVMSDVGENLVYVGQNFSAYCETSSFYFSKGIQWAVRWKNNSLQYLNESYNPNAENRLLNDFINVMFPVHLDMETLICYAPVWNSTEWVTAELEMEIRESLHPIVTVLESDHAHWILNDSGKSLTCLAHGEPIPYVEWEFNNESIHTSTLNMEVITDYENGTSVLSFTRVTHAVQGEYSCVAVNFVGTDQALVTVYVSDTKPGDRPSSSAGLAIFITTVVSFCLLVIVLFLIWKLKLQKRVIDHLAGVVFRDLGK